MNMLEMCVTRAYYDDSQTISCILYANKKLACKIGCTFTNPEEKILRKIPTSDFGYAKEKC